MSGNTNVLVTRLILTFLGGAVVLLPDISRLYNLLHHVPPFSKINEAEKQLFDKNAELTAEDVGFEKIESAVMESSQPYDSTSQYGSFREYGAEFPSSDGIIKVNFDDCRIFSINKKGEGFLSDSDFAVQMVPEERAKSFDSIIDTSGGRSPAIKTVIPNGRFPEMVREYKRSIITNWGMVLLVTGLVIGVFGHIS